MAKELNVKLEKLIENKYGSLSDYAKKIGIEPSHLTNVLNNTSVDKMQPSSLKRYFGPLELDIRALADGRIERSPQIEEISLKEIPLFRKGATPQSFDLIQVFNGQFALDGGGPRLYCKFATNLSNGDYGVFLKKGEFFAGYYFDEEKPLIYPDDKFYIPESVMVITSRVPISDNSWIYSVSEPKSKTKPEPISPNDKNVKPVEVMPFSGITVFGKVIIDSSLESNLIRVRERPKINSVSIDPGPNNDRKKREEKQKIIIVDSFSDHEESSNSEEIDWKNSVSDEK